MLELETTDKTIIYVDPTGVDYVIESADGNTCEIGINGRIFKISQTAYVVASQIDESLRFDGPTDEGDTEDE